MGLNRTSIIVISVVVLVVGFAIGFLGGFFTKKDEREAGKLLKKLTKGADESISRKLLDEIQAENIREYLRELTSRPHLAGTPADLEQAEQLKEFWETEAGLDRAQLYPYQVLLSYPDAENPNRIVLYDDSNNAIHTSQLFEKILRPEQNQSDVVPPFNAYSPPGEPRGELVYVNYGRIDDFIWLTETAGIDPTGYICIARYGKIFRGDKARLAGDFGCVGLILYTDPADYAVDGTDVTYPDSWFLPGTGVQRGTVKPSQGLGDPLTPGYPAIDSAYRHPEEEAGLPIIPVHPVGYDDARVFLENMAGPEASDEWSGKLPITYRLGPGFSNNQWRIQMFVSTHTKNVTTYNVMGFIEGAIEPDRYVMLGNHRDAWVFGALDPSSGTAAMMEVSRAMGKLLSQGWRPRRSIVFCSWGAEEHGLVGSREWVEHFGKLLSDRAVAYLNVDIAVQGNFTLRGRTMPLLHQLMYDAARLVPNPNPDEIANGRETMYDTWAANFPEIGDDGQPTGLPRIVYLGSGSDFAPFVSKVGVTCADLRYHYDPSLGLSSYPLYHSVYETFHLVETFYDPQFSYHKAISQYWGELARQLADHYLLPFDVIQYGISMEKYVKDVVDTYGDLMENTGTDGGLDAMNAAVSRFQSAIETFLDALDNADPDNPLQVRQFNDKMMQLDRVFIDPNGLPGRPLIRNVIFAPSSHDSYAGSTFPGLVDSLYELERAGTPQEQAEKAEVVKQQMAIITYFIEVAGKLLLQDIHF